MLNRDLIVFGLDCKNSTDVIIYLAKLLYMNGYVEHRYIQSVLDREKEFPTGIPTDPAVAIPHTSEKLVIKPGIAIAILKEPVEFYEMGKDGKGLSVKIVLMLAIDDHKRHLKYLKRLTDLLENNCLLNKLNNSTNIEDVYNSLKVLN